MKVSDINGQHVNYKGSDGFQHSGNVVGMSQDGKWYHVKSDKPNAPKAEWHFRIRVDEIEKYLKVEHS